MFDPGSTQALRILALDVASRTGACWGNVGQTPRFMSIKLTREGESSSMDGVGEAAARAIQWLADFTRVERFDRASRRRFPRRRSGRRPMPGLPR